MLLRTHLAMEFHDAGTAKRKIRLEIMLLKKNAVSSPNRDGECQCTCFLFYFHFLCFIGFFSSRVSSSRTLKLPKSGTVLPGAVFVLHQNIILAKIFRYNKIDDIINEGMLHHLVTICRC
jgi:hypothetical protein